MKDKKKKTSIQEKQKSIEEKKETNVKYEHREVDSEQEEDKEVFQEVVDDGYVSITRSINKGPGGTYDPKALEEHIEKIKSEDWKEVSDISKLRPRDRIRYINDKDKFVVGGWVVQQNPKDGYLLWRTGYRNTIWSLQYSDVKQAWTRPPLKETKKKEPKSTSAASKYKKPAEGTEYKYTVEVDGKVIFKTNDKSKKTQFEKTAKYKNALTNGVEYIE